MESESRIRPIDIIRRASASTRRSITVPEWENLTLWFRKVTPADWDAVDVDNEKTAWERSLRLLIRKAELEDGSPAFATGDLYFLQHEAELVVVQRVVNFMFESSFQSVAAAKGALLADPTSSSKLASP
jgi:hypothetical protein